MAQVHVPPSETATGLSWMPTPVPVKGEPNNTPLCFHCDVTGSDPVKSTPRLTLPPAATNFGEAVGGFGAATAAGAVVKV